MKVKVRKVDPIDVILRSEEAQRFMREDWARSCVEMSSDQLRAIFKTLVDRPGPIDWEVADPIVNELERRRHILYPDAKTVEEAFGEFNRHYRPDNVEQRHG